jgi:hypothetical protein
MGQATLIGDYRRANGCDQVPGDHAACSPHSGHESAFRRAGPGLFDHAFPGPDAESALTRSCSEYVRTDIPPGTNASSANADGSFDGIATFGGAPPGLAQLDGLRALGLRVQGFQNLPLAFLRGPRTAMFDAAGRKPPLALPPGEL